MSTTTAERMHTNIIQILNLIRYTCIHWYDCSPRNFSRSIELNHLYCSVNAHDDTTLKSHACVCTSPTHPMRQHPSWPPPICMRLFHAVTERLPFISPNVLTLVAGDGVADHRCLLKRGHAAIHDGQRRKRGGMLLPDHVIRRQIGCPDKDTMERASHPRLSFPSSSQSFLSVLALSTSRMACLLRYC
jgi:hypothetical protein